MSDHTTPTPEPQPRPILMCYHRADDTRFCYDLPDAVRTSLNSMDPRERRRSRRNGGQSQSEDLPNNNFELTADIIRTNEAVFAGSRFPRDDDRFSSIIRTQLLNAGSMLSLAYYSAHPDSNLLLRNTQDPNRKSTSEGQILYDPVLRKLTDDTLDRIAEVLNFTPVIRSGATHAVDSLLNRLRIGNASDLLRKSATSDESMCARAIHALDNNIVTQIGRISELTREHKDTLSPAALPYYEAAMLLLNDARLHLNDWRASIPGLPDKSASRGL